MEENYPEGVDSDNVIELIENNDFSIGQCYDETPALTLRCKKCGTTKFIVGASDYFTAIKCENCQYQVCVHSG